MIAMTRAKTPVFLSENWKRWTKTYIEGGAFSWHNKQKELLLELKQMSQNHCAFCDDLLLPLAGENGEIEHFRPKEKYKCLAFAWANLYPICRRCNGTKNVRFDNLLLRPDAKDYDFFYWFRLDPNTFELKPKAWGNQNWKRAEKTVEFYGLNKEDKIARRQYEYTEIRNGKYKNADIQPFRFV